jgi:hypothetical protein
MMIFAGPTDVIFGDLTDWVVSVIDAIGYVGVALLVALESVFPPDPLRSRPTRRRTGSVSR